MQLQWRECLSSILAMMTKVSGDVGGLRWLTKTTPRRKRGSASSLSPGRLLLLLLLLAVASVSWLLLVHEPPNLKPQTVIAPQASLNNQSASGRAEAKKRPFRPKFLLTNRMIDQLGADHQEQQQPLELSEALQVDSSRVLSLKNVTFLLEPRRFAANHRMGAIGRPSIRGCAAKAKSEQNHRETDEGSTKLLIVVNSKWNNFQRRHKLRSSWLNPANLNKILCDHHRHQLQRDLKGKRRQQRVITEIEYVFALGLGNEAGQATGQRAAAAAGGARGGHSESWPTNGRSARAMVSEEAQQFDDLLVMNLYENYRTMSLKHLSIFKWLLKWRPREQERHLLVLKCDDDAQIKLHQLLDFALVAADDGGRLRDHDQNWIMCARFPANTQVLRPPEPSSAGRRHTGQRQKWQLTRGEYPFDTFPAYCSGLAYLAPSKLIRRLFALAHAVLRSDTFEDRFAEPLWVDDVFVTGILLESMANRPRIFATNGQFCYTKAQHTRRAALKSPCMVWEDTAN